jgi:putative (di)nucleoside polyphosphate hydrolase
MYRELEEEVGLREQHVCVVGQTRDWLRYRLPPRYVRRNSLPRCIGQKQIWFLLRLTADDSAVRLDASERPEFDRWRWVDYWRPVKEVIYFKRPVYVRALQELAPALFPEGPPAAPGWWPSHWRGAGEEERPDGQGCRDRSVARVLRARQLVRRAGARPAARCRPGRAWAPR